MKKRFALALVLLYTISISHAQSTDWLLKPTTQKAEIVFNQNEKEITLQNGLVKRVFSLAANLACVDYRNLITGQQLLRAVSPEARLVINDVVYNVGGVHGQKEKAYLLPEWVNRFTANDSDFQYKTYRIQNITPFVRWLEKATPGKIAQWAMNKKQPTGKMISFQYESLLPLFKGLTVYVHYEVYDGIPLIAKWVTV